MAVDGNMADALVLFRQWLSDAERARVIEPSAMVLTTASANGMPSARMVLLKGSDARGFAFYTNLGSRKAGEIARNPYAALLFHWPELDREVRVTGRVEPVPPAEADVYFASRPVLSRIGAWASRQSRPLPGRFLLLCRIAAFAAIWTAGRLKRPPFWSGFRVVPGEVRFRLGDEILLFSAPRSVQDDSAAAKA